MIPLPSLETLLQVVKGLLFVHKIQKQTSLSEISKIARVEPMVFVSKDVVTHDSIGSILQTTLSLFSAYYLQAIALTAEIGDVKVIKILDALNPDRDETGFLISNEALKENVNLAHPAYTYSLPIQSSPRSYKVSIEGSQSLLLPDTGTVALEGAIDPAKPINEASNLAVGKLLNVEIRIGEDKASSVRIPVLVRLAPAILSADSIMHLLAFKTEDTSLRERYHLWRAGRITFIKDLILCQDLIDEHKKALMHDQDGVFSEITRRGNNAKLYGLMSKMPSLSSASNIFIISEDIARTIELKLGGKLSNMAIRQKAFENTYGMMIIVINRQYERVTFYNRGIAAASELSVKEISQVSKDKGPDIMDILKSYSMGSPAL